MRLALCQINTIAGDPRGNADRILAAYAAGVSRGADLIVVPELAVAGYPPRDLLGQREFLAACHEATQRVVAETGAAGLVLGTALENPGQGKPAFNAAVLAVQGRRVATVLKRLLPTYDVFDEGRYFEPDPTPATPIAFAGFNLGIHICEDAWNEAGFWPRRLYDRDPVEELADSGADLLVNLSASPFHLQKRDLRRNMFARHARRHGIPFVYTNLVGGNDELIFDGDAYALDADGNLLATAQPFREGMLIVDVQPGTPARLTPVSVWSPDEEPASVRAHTNELERAREALVLGIRDYAGKCGFRTAVLGLSGGIDSALTAALAVEALGAEHVYGVSLPSRYSSAGSLTDAAALAKNLGMPYQVLSIEPLFAAALTTLETPFAGTSPGVAEENLQARARGILLMALSNKFGHLLLSTGNKSEMAVGYSTLYGDMAGGLAVISDVPKTLVYALARHLNRDGERIPENSITKAPSAELRPDQTDQDSLPPYDLLDGILRAYIEEQHTVAEMVEQGFDETLVRRVVRMVSRAEYKRRQAPPGLRVTPKAFGQGRRMPMATTWHTLP